MTPQELAEKLAGAAYCNVISKALAAEAAAHGLVVVYGQSDDLMEFEGAIRDELGCYDGGTALVDAKGLLPDRQSIEDDDELRDYFAREPHAKKIDALWASEGNYSWTFTTSIPHATFEITEDGEPYCRGIVFALADIMS
ncbi:hypothetical protein [Burkholderia anthina]|uniref:hypothetical protein n=1 Tax=Burkholderia anthina TaxID=179879 RepID=UPI001588412E|nr:hypothetical protein [Burkholderia anthina]